MYTVQAQESVNVSAALCLKESLGTKDGTMQNAIDLFDVQNTQINISSNVHG